MTHNTTQAYEPIQLFDFQLKSFYFMNERLDQQYSIMNVSPTGAGKTITMLAVAAYRQLIPLIVGPAGIEETWCNEANKYGFFTHYFISYTKLSGKNEKLNHPYLTKMGKTYYPTDYLRQLINMGILVIFDESHLAKNSKTSNLHACHAISRCILHMKTRSRVVLMSATPYDKLQFSESALKLLGLIQDEKMYEYDKINQQYIYRGINELLDVCRKMDKDSTTLILKAVGDTIDKRTIPVISHNLFVHLIKTFYVSRIDPVFPTVITAYNGFYKVSQETEIKMKKIVGQIIEITGYHNGSTKGKIDYGLLNKALHELEKAKLEIAYRLIYYTLSSSPNTKVILYLWYHDTTDHMVECLKMYNPMLLNGQVTPKKRAQTVALFQEKNDKCRLIIGHPVAGGTGLSLDDRDGNWPRVMFIMPTYHLIETTQAMGRIRRVTSKSNALVLFLYSLSHRMEARIMQSLLSKTKVVRDVIDDSSGGSDIKITGELPPWYEENPNDKI